MVDADYYDNSDNEGEIAFAFTTFGELPVVIEADEKLGQGMFIKYQDITDLHLESIEDRKGGFGSTGV